ncbi:MAG: diguanylate cyclase domain protein [Firmicutes bacterium]|nr:diguanylate cyclase domain protein [Bacillota bacterium]
MHKQLADLVDISRLQKVMDALYEATGIPSGIIDKNLTVLTATGWQDICAKFHRIQPEALLKCQESDNYIADNLHTGPYIGYHCKNGMLDYAFPIIVEDEHLATLFIGQFFSAPPQEKFFRQQARKYKFDEEAYITALRKVPIIKKERLRLIIAFFVEVAKLIADMGLRSFKQLETVTFLQDLMNAIPNPIFYKDINGIYQGCNKAFEDFHGIPKSEIVGRSIYDLSPPELAAKYRAMDWDLFSNPQVQIYEYQAMNDRGEKREMIFNKAPYLNLNGKVAGLVGVMVDITQQKQLEFALKSSQNKYRALFNNLFHGFVYFESILDDKGNVVDYRILEVNAAFEKFIGFNKNELIGRKISETIFTHKKATINWFEIFNDLSISGETKTIEQFSAVVKKWLLISAYIPQPGYCAIIVSDITEQKENIERAQHYAYHDPLTGLPNRRLFDDRLALAIAQGKRENGKIAVVFLDLDKFKYINDTFGHEGGDLLLKEVANRLVTCIREGDTASRIGGDEFVIILPNLKDYDEASLITKRILQKCKEPFYINKQVVKISASIGISFFPQDGDDVTSLTRNADIAMYLCKEQGRNGICYSNRYSSSSKA